ncbi:M28 family peptidase [Myxosarcina sp. GI1]|uniref:M28 family peptidase n=1 Tax=Myxosarcina sp. GI1 TaxID=1541065 RepID=UPI00055E81C4|nr:M28 family peptidase [Myxosarcina sp. GI1]
MSIESRLYEHLQQIVRERDPYVASGGHFLVREYIRQQLELLGTVTIHEFTVREKIYQNLILDLPASKNRNLPPILIGAHYDAVPGTPGADDNATGVAVLLEMAKYFSDCPLKYPLRLVAFDLEEYGMLGSTAYARALKAKGQALRLMLSLEMLGYCDDTPNSQTYPDLIKRFYPDRGNFIALVGNLAALGDLFHLSRQIKRQGTPCQFLPDPSSGKWIPQTGLSDHYPFWQQGYRAIMITDTAMLRNPNYHRSSDTIDSLDLNFLTNVCQSLIVAIEAI